MIQVFSTIIQRKLKQTRWRQTLSINNPNYFREAPFEKCPVNVGNGQLAFDPLPLSNGYSGVLFGQTLCFYRTKSDHCLVLSVTFCSFLFCSNYWICSSCSFLHSFKQTFTPHPLPPNGQCTHAEGTFENGAPLMKEVTWLGKDLFHLSHCAALVVTLTLVLNSYHSFYF